MKINKEEVKKVVVLTTIFAWMIIIMITITKSINYIWPDKPTEVHHTYTITSDIDDIQDDEVTEDGSR